MPKTFIADRDVVLTLPFLVDSVNGQDFIVPTTASYTLRDHTGAAVVGHAGIDLAPTTTQATITLPADVNGKTRTTERRIVEYQFDSHYASVTYYLIDWAPVDATPEDVRRLIGVNAAELPDADVDLYGAYLGLKERLGNTVLDDALDTDMLRANRAIALYEALRQLPALRLKAAKSEASGQDGFTRFDVDWDTLRTDLGNELDKETALLAPPTGSTLFLAAGRGYDPFTGV